MTSANARPCGDVTTTTPPATFYADPAWFQRELERIHGEMWPTMGELT